MLRDVGLAMPSFKYSRCTESHLMPIMCLKMKVCDKVGLVSADLKLGRLNEARFVMDVMDILIRICSFIWDLYHLLGNLVLMSTQCLRFSAVRLN